MTLAYIAKLGLKICSTNIGAQKIDGSLFKTFRMIIAGFQVEDKLDRTWFFQELFLMADINMEVVQKMPFLIFSNANI